MDIWRGLAASASPLARAEAEARVFAQMVVALDGWFVHRARGLEGSHGNPLNEVRLLAEGITSASGRFPPTGAIRWQPARSISGLAPGEPICLTEALFSRLCAAFLDAMALTFAS